MKALFIALLTLVSTSSFAQTVIVQAQAKSVQSSTKNPLNSEATGCTYAIVNRGADDIRLFLNSNRESGINGAVDVSRLQLPLVEGENNSGWNSLRVIKKGSTVQFVEKSEAPSFGSIYDIITLEASADLRQIKKGTYQSYMTNLIGIKILQEELVCEF